MAKLAFLGLGVMGYPMAGHLSAAGHEVCVYNRTAAKADAWVAQHGGCFAPTPREAAQGAEFVMACVGNDDDLRSVCLGPDGAFAGMAKARFSSITPPFRRVSRQSFTRRRRSVARALSTRPCPAGRRGRKTASFRSCAAATRMSMPAPSRSSPPMPSSAVVWVRAAQAR